MKNINVNKEKESKRNLMQCMEEKDLLIENLLSRIQSLEEKFNQMQQQERRDKSSQRINDVIMNLEKKLDLFSKQKIEDMQKLAHLQTQQVSQVSTKNVQVSQKATPNINSFKMSMAEDLESLVTIMDGEDFPPINSTSIKTPALEDLDLKFAEEDNVELLSDELPDGSMLMGEKEWMDSQHKHQFDISLNNIQILMNYDNGEDELNKTNGEFMESKKKKQFLKTQKIEHIKGVESDIISSPNPLVNLKKASE
mmetsp:Transcript_29573/g.28777  ORF Transcript_29573/g.28777 Transcript_29573/m.28777 type:complete len:253 (+) Transcript_29573:1976-2734(+)